MGSAPSSIPVGKCSRCEREAPVQVVSDTKAPDAHPHFRLCEKCCETVKHAYMPWPYRMSDALAEELQKPKCMVCCEKASTLRAADGHHTDQICGWCAGVVGGVRWLLLPWCESEHEAAALFHAAQVAMMFAALFVAIVASLACVLHIGDSALLMTVVAPFSAAFAHWARVACSCVGLK